MKEKVIFIPGFTGSKSDTLLLKSILKDQEVVYFDYETMLNESISTLAKKLDRFIKKNDYTKVTLIGMSTGGIIASYCLKFIDRSRTKKLVTICSPFQGSYLARMFFRKKKGLADLRPGSDLLTSLKGAKTKGVRTLNIYSYFDFMVPGNSAKGEAPAHTLFFLHPFIQFYPPILFKIRRFLSND